jgi:hypothetical protein
MSPVEFDLEIKRLAECFGEKHFPRERLRLIWNGVATLSATGWRKVVDKILLTSRTAPMPNEIIELARAIEREEFASTVKGAANAIFAEILPKDMPRPKRCPHCNDSGLVSAIRRGTNYSFAFRCPDENCVSAKEKCNPSDQRWNSSFAKDFELIFPATDDDPTAYESFQHFLAKNYAGATTVNEAIEVTRMRLRGEIH